MNDQQKKLREMIERATAASDDLPGNLDAESAALRKGWLQLGRLIEEDVRSGGAHSAHVHAGNGSHERVRIAPSDSRGQRPAWSFWFVAFAASLLVAAGVAFAFRLFDGTHKPQENSHQIVENNDPATKPTEPVIAPKPALPRQSQPEPHIAATGDHLHWGDSVDDDIAAVGQATIYVQQDAFVQSGGVWEIETGLDELKQEVDQGHL